MDELEFLKKDWQRKEKELPKLSYDQIHQMLWKKSSSQVKWIFYISIIEFVFWIAMVLISNIPSSYNGYDVEIIEEIYHRVIIRVINIIYYAGLLVFIYLFFLNYKRICSIDSVKTLLKNILRTRKTVNYYVWFNLVYFGVSSLILLTILINSHADTIQLHEQFTKNGQETVFYVIMYGLIIFLIGIFLLIIWLFYKLIYGILLKKLKDNYQELKKIDL
ncbi:hypothetical protein NBRC110019_06730 [Neptunitalea chrysea]|uniref:Uncharacterized protein n=1 Tax=Neptunitalea chrysea TaxID=1647581 RepID=A0A9W6ETU0_9FLAO|nr:hypothetical protein [Neptunitalea chrysea]GLB51634.1 hypothetical protein NBRC110019_06730 [Neptunitalea chrysea]